MSEQELLVFPYEITDVEPLVQDELKSIFAGERSGYVQVGPEKYTLPVKFRELSGRFWNFESRPDDVWVATFPRSGTTWTQEMVWLIVNDLNFDQALKSPITERFPFFEFGMHLHVEVTSKILNSDPENPDMQRFIQFARQNGIDYLPMVQGRRLIKTHFPLSLVPPSVSESGSKIIYVARNPKDVAVSHFYFSRMLEAHHFIGDFATFWDIFERDLYQRMPYWSHIREGWERRREPNVLFLFYEDMIKDLPAVIKQVAVFLEKSLSDSDVERLSQHLSFEKFKRNPSVNHDHMKKLNFFRPNEEAFIRSGKSVGKGWPKEFTPELIERAHQWIQANLEKTDMRFPDC